MNRSTSSLAVSRWAGGVFNKFTLLSLAITSILMFLVSCGDTVYESKGGSDGKTASTGSINVYVRDGDGLTPFKGKDAGVKVTLLNGTKEVDLSTGGSVTFKNLEYGEYSVRVEKEGYATSYYSTRIDDYNLLAGEGASGVRTIEAVLFPLTANLKGRLLYQKPDGSTGNAAGVTVYLEIGLNAGVDPTKTYVEWKLEERVYTKTTGPDGSFEFEKVPAVDADFRLLALSTTLDKVLFSDVVLKDGEAGLQAYKGVKLTPGATVTANAAVAFNPDNAAELNVVTYPLSVEKSGDIKIVFTEKVKNIGISNALVKVTANAATGTEIPVGISFEGGDLTITPVRPWSADAGTIYVKLIGLYSENGATLPANYAPLEIAVADAIRKGLTLVNLAKAPLGTTSHDFEIYLKDTAEAVTFEFNKELDVSKLSTSFYQEIIGEAYGVTVAGAKVTVSPKGVKWATLNRGGYIDFSIAGDWVAVDNDIVGTALKVRAFLVSTKEAFVILSSNPALKSSNRTTNEYIIELSDDTSVVSIKFSSPLASSPDAVRERSIARSTAEAYVATYSADNTTLTLDVRKSASWVKDEVITLTGFKSADEVYLNGTASVPTPTVTVKLTRVPTGSFLFLGYITSGSTNVIPKKNADIVLNFDATLSSGIDFSKAIEFTTPQPYVASFSTDKKSIILSTVDTLEWITPVTLNLYASQEETDGKIRGASGEELITPVVGTTPSYKIAGIKFSDKELGAGNPLIGVSVASFNLDTTQSIRGKVARKTDQKIQIVWSRVEEVEVTSKDGGYDVYVYRNGRRSGTEPDVSFNRNNLPSARPTMNSVTAAWDSLRAVTTVQTTWDKANSDFYVGTVDLDEPIGDDLITVVIQPFNKDGDVKLLGVPKSIKDFRGRIGVLGAGFGNDPGTPGTGVGSSGLVSLTLGSTEKSFFVDAVAGTPTSNPEQRIDVTVYLDGPAASITWNEPAISIPDKFLGTGRIIGESLGGSILKRTDYIVVRFDVEKSKTASAVSASSGDNFNLSLSGTDAFGNPVVVEYSSGTVKTVKSNLEITAPLN